MSHQLRDGASTVWFITARDTDLAEASEHGSVAAAYMIAEGDNGHYANIEGELFLKALANYDKFTPGTQLKAWLFTILRNAFYSDIRKYKRETEDVDGRLALQLSEEDAQDHALALKELIAAVARLPETQRRPLVLMGAYGFSQLEAADACGCTVGTIKSRVSRGRATLDHAFGHKSAAPARPAMVSSNGFHDTGSSSKGPVSLSSG